MVPVEGGGLLPKSARPVSLAGAGGRWPAQAPRARGAGRLCSRPSSVAFLLADLRS